MHRENDASGKKKIRKSITMEQKMDILRRYHRGESTATILWTNRKGREDYGSCKSRSRKLCNKGVIGPVHHNGSNRKNANHVEGHRKRQALNVTFDDAKKTAMECYNHLKKKDTGPVPEFNASTGWFYEFKTRCGFHNVKPLGESKSTDEDATAAYPDRLRPSSEKGGGLQARADFYPLSAPN